MNGAAVIGELLSGSPELLAIVPASRIKAGALPQGVTLPAVSVTSISGTDLNMLSSWRASAVVTERVQVTVLAANYRDKTTIIDLVRRACANKQGNFASVTEVSVLLDGTGPDFPVGRLHHLDENPRPERQLQRADRLT
jgi:hypothetical protein